jgi:hypothetical protein
LCTRGQFHLHAAAVISPRDELWLICGAQRAGKTTLTAALGLAGWRPISDDSLLVSADQAGQKLRALKKYFHLGDELLRGWRALDGIARHHQYLDRTCAGGLEFFGTRDLADASFQRIDHILLPRIVPAAVSRLLPLSQSEALLTLAEQSTFFQLWRAHTERQWGTLTRLAQNAICHRFLSGADLLADPLQAARLCESLQFSR